ncbi:MAG: antibiotic biosynthesis monooxygenase family protein [Dehalococcoidia bacterium]
MIISFITLKFKEDDVRLGLSLLRQIAAFNKKQPGCVRASVGEPLDGDEAYILFSQWEDKRVMDFALQALQKNPEAGKSFAQLVNIAMGKPGTGRFEMH